ncbi:retinal-binding protein [Perilla frutescens var. hirtella]|nr:retinal-binding protein [Perilla frutescens var. frutescens]KAH6788170.1 retinal-binding protein [Perilla frutescens var. hirtella]
MVSTEGLVPITRAFLASYYDKYPFTPLSGDVSRLSEQIHAMATDLLKESPPSQGERLLIQEAGSEPPHKVDENMWKNREQIEEIIFLLQQPATVEVEDDELDSVLGRLLEKFKSALEILESFQARNSEFVFNTVMTYMPQDFRGTIIRQQKERSERNKQAAVDALTSSGGSIRDKYAMLWKQQMERRRQLAELGSATGVYKTLMKYLVGVPEVLMDFVRQINDDQGPMEEQRQRYGPPLYSLTRMVQNIRLFLSLLWGRLGTRKLQKHEISILEEAANVYNSELERFIKFIGEVFTNSPFLIAAEDAGALAARNNDDYKEITVSAGGTHEVSLTVESTNSYIAWDFSLVQGKLNTQDIGFSVECIDFSGRKTLILPYRRYEADQGNFCTCASGDYKLIWDNSYSTFFRKVIRYKVDCIPPVTTAAD